MAAFEAGNKIFLSVINFVLTRRKLGLVLMAGTLMEDGRAHMTPSQRGFDRSTCGDLTMKRFIHRENLRLLRDQLTRTNDEAKCRRIVRMIEEEEMKESAAAEDRA